MFLWSTSLHLTAVRPLQVMSSSDLTPTAGLGPADTPRKTQGPAGSDAVTQSVSLFPLSQHRPSVSLQCWRVLTRTAGCLSEEITGCLTTLVVIKDTLLYTNIGIWLRDRSYVCNYTSALNCVNSCCVSLRPKGTSEVEEATPAEHKTKSLKFYCSPHLWLAT